MAPKDPALNQNIDIDPFFRYLDQQKVPFCVVGPTERLPHHAVGDIDVVVDATPLRILQYVVSFWIPRGISIVQCVQHEATAQAFILWQKYNGDDRFLHIDICNDYYRNGRLFISAKDLVAGRRNATNVRKETEAFYVPRPEAAFLYYLLKKIEKRQLTDENTQYLSQLWREAPARAHEKITRYFNVSGVEVLAKAAEHGDWGLVQSNLTILRRQLVQHTRRTSLRAWIGEGRRIWMRITQPTGLHIVFLGPDGSGKSAVLERVFEALKPVFGDRRERFHLFPTTSSGRSDAPVTDPYGQQPYGVIGSVAKLGVWFLRYTLGWARRIWPARVKKTLVLFDRYYHDLLVDPMRYRYGGSMWLARAIGHLIAKPDLWILLNAPVETLQARKQEVSWRESTRQRQAYLDFIRGHENAVLIDASQPLDIVAKTAMRAILEFMAKRTAARLGSGMVRMPNEWTVS